jgi:hypothetical protein
MLDRGHQRVWSLNRVAHVVHWYGLIGVSVGPSTSEITL